MKTYSFFRVISTVILFGLLTSCIKKNTPQQQDENKFETLLHDTLTVKGSAVVFYKPTDEESIVLMHKSHNPKYHADMVDFQDVYETFIAALEGSPILAFATSARYISVESVNGIYVYDRLKDTIYSGALLSSPMKLPRIINTAHTQSDYSQAIKNYFF